MNTQWGGTLLSLHIHNKAHQIQLNSNGRLVLSDPLFQ